MQISILQGTIDGDAVYVERHFPTTSENGLVTIEIGTGTIINGTFSDIDWSSGIYFIKSGTDPNGGANYTITGTSQLLSVPYALHAKTAESVTGGITETDPIFGASVASGITVADTTNWNNKQDQLTAGTGIDITGNTISATTYSVGDFAHGGIVFWVDETGQHGLVCAKEDQSSGIKWRGGSTNYSTMARGDGIYAGKMNTSIIIAVHSAKNDFDSHAALICANNTDGDFGDWYLPSKEELNLMYQNKATIDSTATANSGSGFASAWYWSSTETNLNDAWGQNFGNGGQSFGGKHDTVRVRAVRAF